MSINVSSRSAVYSSLFRARPAPPAIPRPGARSAETPAARLGASPAATALTKAATYSATINAKAAQKSPEAAPKSAESAPGGDAGVQDRGALFGDINGDNELNSDDITALLDAFNTSVSTADLNADGNVDTADLGALISAIRDLNSQSKATITPDGGQNRDLQRVPAVDLPLGQGQPTANKASANAPDNPIIETPVEEDAPTAQPGVFGDLTGDGLVDADDLAALRGSFQSSQSAQAGAQTVGDLNGDGRVDTADLGTIMGILRD